MVISEAHGMTRRVSPFPEAHTYRSKMYETNDRHAPLWSRLEDRMQQRWNNAIKPSEEDGKYTE